MFRHDEDTFLQISETISGYSWQISVLNNPNYRRVFGIERDLPTDFAIRQTNSNSTTWLYYAIQDERTEGYILYKESVSLQFDASNEARISIGINCATTIFANSELVVVTCTPVENFDTMFMVYRESDLKFLVSTGSDSKSLPTMSRYNMGSHVEIISSDNYVSVVL